MRTGVNFSRLWVLASWVDSFLVHQLDSNDHWNCLLKGTTTTTTTTTALLDRLLPAEPNKSKNWGSTLLTNDFWAPNARTVVDWTAVRWQRRINFCTLLPNMILLSILERKREPKTAAMISPHGLSRRFQPHRSPCVIHRPSASPLRGIFFVLLVTDKLLIAVVFSVSYSTLIRSIRGVDCFWIVRNVIAY